MFAFNWYYAITASSSTTATITAKSETISSTDGSKGVFVFSHGHL